MPRFIEETVIDPYAADRLAEIVRKAGGNLVELGNEPAIAHGDLGRIHGDYWAKVQVDTRKGDHSAPSYWSALHKFGKNDDRTNMEKLKVQDFVGISEKASAVHGTPDEEMVEVGAAFENPLPIRMQNLISDLEKTDWRELSEKAFSSRGFSALGVYLFHGGVWLVRGRTIKEPTASTGQDRYNYKAEIWHLPDEGSLFHFAQVALPHDLYRGGPMTIAGTPSAGFTDININAIERLSSAIRNWFLPGRDASLTPQEQTARTQISQLFEDLANQLRKCTSEPVTYFLGKSRDQFFRVRSEIHFAGNRFPCSSLRSYNWDPEIKKRTAATLEPAPDIIQDLGKILDAALKQKYQQSPKAELKALFSAAFSSPIEDYDQLYLKVTPKDVLFTRGFSLFRLLDGQLVPEGVLSAAEIETLYFSPASEG
ncbi:hypothetical protein [Roseibium sp. M-1]